MSAPREARAARRPGPARAGWLLALGAAVTMACGGESGDPGADGQPADATVAHDGSGADASIDAASDAAPAGPVAWSAPLNLSESATFSDLRLNWGNSIAVTATGTVHVVWREVTDVQGNQITGQVVYRRRVAGAWSAVTPLSPVALGTGHPKIAASGEDVYVVWHEFDPDPAGDDAIWFTRSAAEGAPGTFSAPLAIVTDAVVTALSPLQEMATTPSIAAAGEGVYVVWADDRLVPACGFNVSEIYLQASGNRGDQWAGVHRVTEPDCRSSWTPTVAASEAFVHVAWTDERHNAADCGLGGGLCAEEEYYRRLTDHGATPDTAELRLTEDPPSTPAQSWAGSLAAGPGEVHYPFMDNAGGAGFAVRYRRSLAGGSPWDAATATLSDPAPGWISARPTVALADGALHVVWMDVQGDTAARIRHRWSADRGGVWSPITDATSGAYTFAVQPSVAAHAGHVYVVWNDLAEIFFAEGAP